MKSLRGFDRFDGDDGRRDPGGDGLEAIAEGLQRIQGSRGAGRGRDRDPGLSADRQARQRTAEEDREAKTESDSGASHARTLRDDGGVRRDGAR